MELIPFDSELKIKMKNAHNELKQAQYFSIKSKQFFYSFYFVYNLRNLHIESNQIECTKLRTI